MLLTTITVISAADDSSIASTDQPSQIDASSTPSVDDTSSTDSNSQNSQSSSSSSSDVSTQSDTSATTQSSTSTTTASDSTQAKQQSTTSSNTQTTSDDSSQSSTNTQTTSSSTTKDTNSTQSSTSDVKTSSSDVSEQPSSINTNNTVDEKTQLKGDDVTSTVTSYTGLVNEINTIKSSGTSDNTYTIKLGDGSTDQTFTITEPITWGDSQATNLVIDGQNHVTIDGQGLYRFMTVEEGYILTLQNITISNCCNSESYGGTIINEGSLYIKNSVFTNNVAKTYGGAIYNNNGKLTVSTSTFRDNSPTYSSSINGHGGAIYNNNGIATIEDSVFTGNNAYYGGAIYNNGTSAQLTVLRSTFTENKATGSSEGDGGAIYNNKGEISISDSTFTQNTAAQSSSRGDGGAIWTNGTMTIYNSTFTENTANGNGGTIHNYGNLTIELSTFTNNTAGTSGGVIYNYYGGDLIIDDSTFTRNTAKDGGAIYSSDSANSKLTVRKSTFTENTASGVGGAIYSQCEAIIVDSNFKDNSGKYGETIYTVNSLKSMTGNTFSMNDIIIEGSETVTLYSPISDNSISTTSTDPTDKIIFKIYDESGTLIDSVDAMYDSSTKETYITYQFEESGIYSVEVVYRDFENYIEFDVYDESIEIPVLTIEAEKDYVYITDPVLITGTLTSNDIELINAEVIISIDNENHTVYTNDTGGYSYTFTPTITGIHTITATYHYTTMIEVTKTITITADQLGTKITLDPIEDVKLYDFITISGELLDSEGNIVTGQTIYITINDEIESLSTDNWGKFSVIYEIESVGSYYVLVEHPESGKYKESHNTTSFTAAKLDTTITVDSLTAKQYETVTLTAHVVDEKGNAVNEGYASFKLNDVTLIDDKGDIIYVSVMDGVGKLEYTVENSPKEYTITGLYYGLEDYSNAKSEYATLTVVSSAVETTTTVDNVTAKEGETINLTAHIIDEHGNPVTEGQVAFKLNDVTITDSNNKVIYIDVTNGEAKLEYIVTNSPKTYTISAVYSGTDKYLDSTSEYATLTVISSALETTTTVEDVTAKQEETVNLTAHIIDSEGNPVTEGQVAFKLNDVTITDSNNKVIYIDVTNGEAKLEYTVTNSPNTYTITGLYYGTDKYLDSKSDYGTLTVTSATLETTTTVDDVTAKKGETINLTAHIIDSEGNPVTEGQVAFKLNDVTITDSNNKVIYIDVTNGEAKLEYTVTNSPNTYTITGLYYGTDKYLDSKSDYGVLTVISVALETTTTVYDITASQGETINLVAQITDENGNRVTEGQVTFKINNTTIKDTNGNDIYVNVRNGEATLQYTAPTTEGTYNITATYYGNDKYYDSTSNTATLTVTVPTSVLKTTTTIDNTISRQGETISLTAHVVDENNNLVNEGQVTFKINNTTIKDTNGNDIYVDVVNGVATLSYTVTNPVNYYNITATYHGNDKYQNSTSNTGMLVVESSVLKTSTTVDDAIAKVNETITLTAHVVDENGNPVTQGPVSFRINNETIKDTNGQTLYVNVINGEAVLEYKDTNSADVYNIVAVYYGDEYYQTSTSDPAIFTSITSNLTTIITVDNITAKQHETINLTAHVVDENGNPVLEGQVAFKINDVTLKDDNGDVIYVDVVNGVAQLSYTIDNAAKTYSIVGLYYGSNHYNTAKSEYETLTVEESSLDTTITVDNVTGIYHRTVNLTAHIVDENGNRVTEGRAAFKINDVTLKDDNGDVIYVDVVNGTATLEYAVTNSPKDYTITGLYYGSGGYHDSKSEYGTLTVEMSIMETSITVDDITGQYDETINITARVTDEYGYAVTSGRVIFKINGVTLKYANGTNIYVNVVNGIATLEYTITNNPKDYTIMAVYEGTSNYITSRSEDAVLTVENKVVGLVVDKPTGAIKSGDTVTLKATILDDDPALADEGVVIFKLNGVTLKDENGNNLEATIVNGVATLNYTIPVDMAGKDYNLTAVYSNKNYDRVEANNTLTLVRSNIETYLDPITITQGENTRIYMELYDENYDHLERSTKVAIKINGKTQINTETSNGILNITIPTSNLSSKEYNIEVVFGENSAYYERRVYSTLTVEK